MIFIFFYEILPKYLNKIYNNKATPLGNMLYKKINNIQNKKEIKYSKYELEIHAIV